jgi:hypothetical protein
MFFRTRKSRNRGKPDLHLASAVENACVPPLEFALNVHPSPTISPYGAAAGRFMYNFDHTDIVIVGDGVLAADVLHSIEQGVRPRALLYMANSQFAPSNATSLQVFEDGHHGTMQKRLADLSPGRMFAAGKFPTRKVYGQAGDLDAYQALFSGILKSGSLASARATALSRIATLAGLRPCGLHEALPGVAQPLTILAGPQRAPRDLARILYQGMQLRSAWHAYVLGSSDLTIESPAMLASLSDDRLSPFGADATVNLYVVAGTNESAFLPAVINTALVERCAEAGVSSIVAVGKQVLVVQPAEVSRLCNQLGTALYCVNVSF